MVAASCQRASSVRYFSCVASKIAPLAPKLGDEFYAKLFELAPEARDTFARIVRRSFSQRRKMMFKLLKEDWPEPRLAAEFERLKLSPQIRAEKVSLEQFIRLARNLSGPPPP